MDDVLLLRYFQFMVEDEIALSQEKEYDTHENVLSHTTENESHQEENQKSTYEERIHWALNKPEQITKQSGTTLAKQRQHAQDREKEWGNRMIGQKNNGQWTTLLGENLVREYLEKHGQHPRRPERKSGFAPDWETDDYIWEVKTSNWWVSGTAGEKVLGTWIKYQDIPILYAKPLKIVCVAYQEYELTHGKVKYFGDNVTDKTKQILDIAKSWNIEYVRFSDLVSSKEV